jgi:hypothetical protein
LFQDTIPDTRQVLTPGKSGPAGATIIFQALPDITLEQKRMFGDIYRTFRKVFSKKLKKRS